MWNAQQPYNMHSLSHSPLQIFSKPGADSNSAKDYVYSFTWSSGRIYFRIYKVIHVSLTSGTLWTALHLIFQNPDPLVESDVLHNLYTKYLENSKLTLTKHLLYYNTIVLHKSTQHTLSLWLT